jgi:hypothetical protein
VGVRQPPDRSPAGGRSRQNVGASRQRAHPHPRERKKGPVGRRSRPLGPSTPDRGIPGPPKRATAFAVARGPYLIQADGCIRPLVLSLVCSMKPLSPSRPGREHGTPAHAGDTRDAETDAVREGACLATRVPVALGSG